MRLHQGGPLVPDDHPSPIDGKSCLGCGLLPLGLASTPSGPGQPSLTDERTVQLKLGVPESFRKRIRERAAANGEDMATLIRRAIGIELV